MTFDSKEQSILEKLDSAVAQKSMIERFDRAALDLDAQLADDPGLLLAWETIPLQSYGVDLPDAIQSSWVFILRADIATLPERHPNSHQRMVVYRGEGDFQTWGDGRWQSNDLVSDPSAPLQQRWVSIPPNTWHRSMKPRENLVVVSFHTATEQDLIEENGDPETATPTHRRKYAEASPGSARF
ncbi:MAG TPA: hypothetical protein VEZ90_14030 [Blastocatellia bacterium]|nr:hypothetical protein [Blastocatellia bacterium]